MNYLPLIDPRKTADIIENIKQKAQIYTPEWKYEPDEVDGGAALAELFAQMFGETIDRLNNVPYKYYIEFLNLLEVSSQSINPATGMAVFELTAGGEKSVPVRKGIQMYSDIPADQSQDGAGRVIFETESEFIATPAKITGIYSVNPRRDLIEKVNLEEASARFFDPSLERNIQQHRFALACKDVFKLKSPANIVLSLKNTGLGYLNEEYVSRLADSAFAKWSYFDGNGQYPFDKVLAKDGKLHLIKDNHVPLQPRKLEIGSEETGEQIWINCDMQSNGMSDEIVMNRIRAGSASLQKEKQEIHISPQLLYANDNMLDPEEGGYCFGKQPMPYDCFYIASDEVFSKRNARVNIEFNIKTVVRQIGSAQDIPQYNFNNKYIVEKEEPPPVTPDSMFISRIVWEYWNGLGWAHLKVEGDLNPFHGQNNSPKKNISFRCPADMASSLQHSLENYWIRARAVEIENPFSIYANLLLPAVESVSLAFDYMEALQPVEWVYTENNCERAVYKAPDSATSMRLFQPMKENVHGVYFAFDLPPAGYPVNFYFKTEGQSKLKQVLSFEYIAKDIKGEGVWYELKVNDRTDGLKEDGIISVYAPSDFIKNKIFGQEAHWLRIVDKNLRFSESTDSCPVVEKIIPNVVEIVQKQTVVKEMFQAAIFESGKEITLANHPVLECQLWVNEIKDISKAEMSLLAEKNPDSLDIQYNSSGYISGFWVKWERCGSLINSLEDSRHYMLNSHTGQITFGDGKRGKVPSVGENPNIRVDYSFGGGRRGNLPEDSIKGLLMGLPYVDRVRNIEMTCGGSDKHDLKTLEYVGPLKLRHRERAVTATDYESIVMEHFPEIRDVKCIANYDRFGRQAWGHVTLVVIPYDLENRNYSLKLCKKIGQYLSELLSCELLAGERFSTVPAIIMKLNVTVTVSVESYENAAETEKQITESLTRFLNPGLAGRQRLKIEEIPAITNIYGLLKKVKNVASIQEVILEGRYYDGNVLKVVPLDERFNLRYVVVTSGEHTVKIF